MAFDPKRKQSFPDIEVLLTEISVNLELFDASRPIEGSFTKKQLENVRKTLLSAIAEWFHEIYGPASQKPWLRQMIARLLSKNAAIVSFNWDLILDQLLFERGPGPASYGLDEDFGSGPVLLKPHGSLNWYESDQIRKVPAEKRSVIFQSKKPQPRERIEAFLRPREIKSKVGNRYTPLIVPPTYLKDSGVRYSSVSGTTALMCSVRQERSSSLATRCLQPICMRNSFSGAGFITRSTDASMPTEVAGLSSTRNVIVTRAPRKPYWTR